MSIRRSRLIVGVAFSLATMILTSIDAQVLPKNRNRRAEPNPPATTPQNVERTDAQRDAARTTTDQTRVRTEADANVTRTRTGERTNVSILRSTQIVGTMVNVQDRRVGKITEIVFNQNGCVDFVVVDINGRMAPIPWRVGNYDF